MSLDFFSNFFLSRKPQQIQGIELLRTRLLLLILWMTGIFCSVFFAILAYNGRDWSGLLPLALLASTGWVLMFFLRWTGKLQIIALVYFLLLGVLNSFGIYFNSQTIFAIGFTWYPALVAPSYFLCGKKWGTLSSIFLLICGCATYFSLYRSQQILPYDQSLTTYAAVTIASVALMCLGMFLLMLVFRKLVSKNFEESLAQKGQMFSTARMQELAQMSGQFAQKSQMPLEIISTALQNLEEPMRQLKPQTDIVLAQLPPIEKSIAELAEIAKSFSLFSRRFLEEGLEQTTVNTILRHVEIIYNSTQKKAQENFQWSRAEPDLNFHTQSAKLVMLIINQLRGLSKKGAKNLHLSAAMDQDEIVFHISYYRQGIEWKREDGNFDKELNEDIIDDLCEELKISRRFIKSDVLSICQMKVHREQIVSHAG